MVGRIPTTISGSGILIKSGGIYDIDVLGSGVVSEINVDVGDRVTVGQVIAQVAQPQLQQQMDQAKTSLEGLRTERDDAAQYATSSVALETASLDRQQESLAPQIEAISEQSKWLLQQEQAQREALSLGVITFGSMLFYLACSQPLWPLPLRRNNFWRQRKRHLRDV